MKRVWQYVNASCFQVVNQEFLNMVFFMVSGFIVGGKSVSSLDFSGLMTIEWK